MLQVYAAVLCGVVLALALFTLCLYPTWLLVVQWVFRPGIQFMIPFPLLGTMPKQCYKLLPAHELISVTDLILQQHVKWNAEKTMCKDHTFAAPSNWGFEIPDQNVEAFSDCMT